MLQAVQSFRNMQFNHAANRSIIPQHAVQSRRKQFNRSAACGSITPKAVQSFRSVRFNHPASSSIVPQRAVQSSHNRNN
jgi:hypothetical protein